MGDHGQDPCTLDYFASRITNQTIVAHNVKSDSSFDEAFLAVLPYLNALVIDCPEWSMTSSDGKTPFLGLIASDSCLAWHQETCYQQPPCPKT